MLQSTYGQRQSTYHVIFKRPILNKTPYELWKDRKLTISYIHPFGCSCFMLNTKENLDKCDSKARKCIMLDTLNAQKATKYITLKHELWKNQFVLGLMINFTLKSQI